MQFEINFTIEGVVMTICDWLWEIYQYKYNKHAIQLFMQSVISLEKA